MEEACCIERLQWQQAEAVVWCCRCVLGAVAAGDLTLCMGSIVAAAVAVVCCSAGGCLVSWAA
jgi:hypothetical protein